MSAQKEKPSGSSDVEAGVAALAGIPVGEYDNFLSIDPTKQERIITTALELFAQQDYAQVSTNEIVKRASISKGLLFHYFGSKAGLYLYLKHHAVALFAEAQLGMMDLSGGDVFDVMWESTEIKLKVAAQYPLAMQFYVRTFTDGSLPPEIQESIQKDLTAAYGVMDQITGNLDETLLKEGLNKDKVGKIIYYVCEGISHEVIAELTPEVSNDYWQATANDLKSYFDVMRELFYK